MPSPRLRHLSPHTLPYPPLIPCPSGHRAVATTGASASTAPIGPSDAPATCPSQATRHRGSRDGCQADLRLTASCDKRTPLNAPSSSSQRPWRVPTCSVQRATCNLHDCAWVPLRHAASHSHIMQLTFHLVSHVTSLATHSLPSACLISDAFTIPSLSTNRKQNEDACWRVKSP
jgi:hypothetical protein